MKITTRPCLILLVIALTKVQKTHSQKYSIRIGSIFRSQDSALSSSLQDAVSSINNSTLILPDTRLDLHSVFTDGDFVGNYQAVCTQLQHSVLAIFSSLQETSSDSVVTEVLNTWHLPHFSSSIITRLEAARQPFTLHLGPSREDLTRAVESLVMEVAGEEEEEVVGLVTHHTGVLLVEQLISSLQAGGHSVQLSVLQTSDIRPELGRLRRLNTIIVDISFPFILPFLHQALQVALLKPSTTIIFTSLDFPPSSQLEFVTMTGVRLVSLSLEAGLDQTEDHRAVLLRSGLHLLTSVLSSLPDLPSSQRLNCSDSDSVSSHGQNLLTQVKAEQEQARLELHLVVRRSGQEIQAGVFSTETQNLTLLHNVSLREEDRSGENKLSQQNLKEDNLSISAHILDEWETQRIFQLLESVPEVRFLLIAGRENTTELEVVLKGCDVVICNSDQLVNIVNTITFSPVFTNISSPAQPPTRQLLQHLQHLHYLLGFLLSFCLTVLVLSLASHTRPHQDWKISVLDSSWLISTASLLTIQHTRLHSASTRVLVLGWTLFSISYFISFLSDILTGSASSPRQEAVLYILGSRDCPQVERTVAGTANLTASLSQQSEPSSRILDVPIVPYVVLGMTLLVCFLTTCLEVMLTKCGRADGKDRESQSSEETAGSEQKLLRSQALTE